MRQRMSINTKRELLQRIRREYLAAGRARKDKLLNSLIEATGYNRKYAITLLNQAPTARPIRRRTRRSKFGSDVIDAVCQLWRAANGICAKRLLPFLPTLIKTLERFGHMKLDKHLKRKVLGMSLSTLERILKKEREKDRESKGKSLTRPGSLLKKQIAVKIFSQWNDQEVGFFEVDLVAHCGGDISGRFIQTLTMTDIATGWTETVPLLYKADTHVRAGIEKIIELLPFKLKGIDCDNGKEFLNNHLVKWCETRKITFTRSREYRKNDQAHVEEKNGSVVRRLVGYERFEGSQPLDVMTQLYSASRLYINYFQPSMKLIKKTRIGAKVTKEYDTAKTPLERLLDFKTLPKTRSAILQREFLQLDPVALLAEMARLQEKLWHIASSRLVQEQPDITVKLAQREKRKQETVTASTSTLTQQGHTSPKRASRPKKKKKKKSIGAVSGRRNVDDVRIDITQDFVQNVVFPPSRENQILYRDSKLIGFGLRVTPRSSKSYFVEARVNGKTRRVTMGRAEFFSIEEARDEAVRLLRQMHNGITPMTLRRKHRT